jgi:MFS family permease
MMADLYQGRSFGSIYAFINVGNGIGGAFGPWLGGYLHDLTGGDNVPHMHPCTHGGLRPLLDSWMVP